MHVLIIGFGSIGQRHARILLQQGNVISVVSARTDVPYPTYSSLSAAISSHKFDYILICNETNLHLPALVLLHQNNVNVPVFVEKPFANLLPVNLPTFSFPLCVGYVLRYHPLISSIKRIIADCAVYSAYSYCGQYLPYWRPERDYRLSYSAQADGGGVLLDLSHEIDYLIFLFGGLTPHHAFIGKLSSLDLNCDDTASILASSILCPHINLSLNYLDMTKQRFLVVHGSFGTIRADFVSNTLLHNETLTSFDTALDELYLNQHLDFLRNPTSSSLYCGLDESLEVLSFIEKAWLIS